MHNEGLNPLFGTQYSDNFKQHAVLKGQYALRKNPVNSHADLNTYIQYQF